MMHAEVGIFQTNLIYTYLTNMNGLNVRLKPHHNSMHSKKADEDNIEGREGEHYSYLSMLCRLGTAGAEGEERSALVQ